MPEKSIPMHVAVQRIIQALIDRQPEDISDAELRRRLTAEVAALDPSPLREEMLRVISQLQFLPH
jgi:hypothetical protein